ncbi:MAG: methyltransferase [Curvibacter sp. RIFCSPHIGHO2_12_FULL_63_18]|uniref:class I SAM-dependent methyltransferase n=1 Tax=Rhodoferax sp. TaxID=50421 RepID=UPI0008C05DF6|nr:class I SAM-dependent methyltransferase [Rhodoferax sp.]OGO95326.1 MAG: methyltransferase [Curvibacter sp. GWA2_63_95]OGO99279.1 MAG: methyltransferase [Curvibacter sp. RIFCSPHIGHO2_12_FULL_63_18]HCX81162.1 methyltransferase [Rhodoferax sp.]
MYKEISKCRVCGSEHLKTVLSLGVQALTGVFPKSEKQPVTSGPVDMVWCEDCNLVQLKQSYSLGEMYGENYGYRSGLNAAMVRHLEGKIRALEALAQPSAEDVVIDIGSNDATSLKAYTGKQQRVGIDPTGTKFKRFYTEDIELIPDFFSAQLFNEKFPGRTAKIVTSIAMFYDLESPMDFVKEVYNVLAHDGIWHFEQSYLPSMLDTNSYDTICHEHLEFYSLSVVKNMLEKVGFRIIDVQLNDVNGGSFAVTACKQDAHYTSNSISVERLLSAEKAMKLDTIDPYLAFAERVFAQRKELVDLINTLIAGGKRVMGYGASTKGNVLLQYCNFTSDQLSCIAEVNPDKYGSMTPGTHIKIVSEAEAKADNPDYLLVLPWHFKAGILAREKEYLAKGGKFIFPLPNVEIV